MMSNQPTNQEAADKAAAQATAAQAEATAAQAAADADAAAAKAAQPRREGLDIVGDSVKTDLHELLLERSNNEKIKTYAYDWEIPILQRIHGDHAPQIVSTYEVDLPADANVEWDRLKRKYNRKDVGQASVVEDVLQGPDALAKTMGVKFNRSTSATTVRSANSGSKRKPKAK